MSQTLTKSSAGANTIIYLHFLQNVYESDPNECCIKTVWLNEEGKAAWICGMGVWKKRRKQPHKSWRMQ